MKFQFLILFFTALILNADITPENNESLAQDNNFDWLLGDWTRLNDENGITTTENWEKSSINLYSGRGLAVKNNDIVFREDLRILKKNGNWVYEVRGVNSDTTDFILTSISDHSFTAVNPENPFPKEIKYRKENGILIAEISDDENKIVFEFKKDQK